MTEEKRFKSSRVKPVSILLLISVLLNIVLIILIADIFPNKKALKAENTELTQQLKQANSEIIKFKGISANIDKIVQEAELKIELKEKEISRLIRDKRLVGDENKKLQGEIDSLKEIYLTSIDSLLVEREQLKILNNTLESMNDAISDLRSQLGLARELITDNLKAEGIRINSAGKKQTTALAKRTSQLSICFDIIPNRVTSSGLKNINVVVTAPDGRIIKDVGLTESVFWHPEYKKDAELSKTYVINYEKQKMNFCTTINFNEKLITGLYVVEIFSKENKLGMSTFSLR